MAWESGKHEIHYQEHETYNSAEEARSIHNRQKIEIEIVSDQRVAFAV